VIPRRVVARRPLRWPFVTTGNVAPIVEETPAPDAAAKQTEDEARP
jgi:hypothetical protein